MLRYFGAEECCRGERSIARGWRQRAAVEPCHLGGPGSPHQSFGLIETDTNWRSKSFELDHTVH